MSSYCDRDDIEAVFGVDNVELYADLDNDDDSGKITARIAQAISVASEEIDDLMRGLHYRLPLATAGGTTPTSIANLAAHLAGLWLYESRGAVDLDREGSPVHRLRYLREWTDRVINDIQSGRRKLDAM